MYTKSDWTSKSSPHCIFIGYSETENLYELWDVEKAALIRNRDVVFWEHEFSHPSLSTIALPHGVSIYSGIADKLVPHLQPDTPQPSQKVPPTSPFL